MKSQGLMPSLAAATLAFAALAASGTASANDVYWSIGVSSPGIQVGVQNAPPVVYRPVVVYSQPQVVYQQPQLIYQQPQVVYQQPQVVYQQPQVVYVRPQPVYVQPPPIYYTRPAPVYYPAPQVIYYNNHQPGHHGWQRGHGQNHWNAGPQVALRISGQGRSDDGGRKHH